MGSNAYPFVCPRCGSDTWTYCFHDSCSDCVVRSTSTASAGAHSDARATPPPPPPRTEAPVSDLEAVAASIAGIAEAFSAYIEASNEYAEHVAGELRRLWDDNAALRDELHTLAQRVAVVEASAGLVFRGSVRMERGL